MPLTKLARAYHISKKMEKQNSMSAPAASDKFQ